MTEISELQDPTGPLAGVRVIDLSVNVLGPVATQILGDMGADVIKVEPPEGDYTRHLGPTRTDGMGVLFLSTNRNKRSIVLDLKNPLDRATLLRLVETADVFVHSMRPGAAHRLGLGFQQLSERFPRLIYASAAGYREDSSRREWPSFDDVIQGASGVAAMNADDGVPRYVPTIICDKLCGYILASSVGMALYARAKTGVGQQVQVAMMDAMVGFNMIEHLWGGVLDDPDLGLGYNRMLSPHRRPYQTADGYLSLLAITNEQWRRLFIAMDRQDLIGDPRFAEIKPRGDNIDELYKIVVDEMKKKTSNEWGALLSKADLPSDVVNDFRSLLADPYLTECGFFQRFEHPTEGRIVSMTGPTTYSRTKASIHRLPPKLGEHTQEILSELRGA